MINHNKIKCLVVDDEPPAREILMHHIANVEALVLVGNCHNAVEAVNFLNKHHVDLLFLDIQMPQLLGTDFIRTLKNPPKVIFTTAYRNYALEGFELDAVDYILKPISFERFLKAVNKVLQTEVDIEPNMAMLHQEEQTEKSHSFLYFRVDRKMVKVYFQDILFIESLKDYIKIVMVSKTIVTKYVLSTLEEMLPANEFLRVHKSFIVNISMIDSYNADSIQVLKNELPIGRLYKFEVARILNASSATN